MTTGESTLVMPRAERVEHIAATYRRHHEQLHRIVRKRGSHNPQIVDDACAHAWMKLLSAEHVDLRPPRWSALAWLTTCAIRRAWELERGATRTVPADSQTLEQALIAACGCVPGVDDLVLQRIRLDLVEQIPERPRRFLLRLALGYSYREIAHAEHATYTTTNKQIARAMHILRELEKTNEEDDACPIAHWKVRRPDVVGSRSA